MILSLSAIPPILFYNNFTGKNEHPKQYLRLSEITSNKVWTLEK